MIHLGLMSQKGGVGKSTLSRLIAREYTVGEWQVRIADLDFTQGTSFNWKSRRLENNIEPSISVELCRSVSEALKMTNGYDMVIFDCPGRSTALILDVAKVSHMIIIPTGAALDDLEPTVKFAHELRKKGISRERIALSLCRIGKSEQELAEIQDYISNAGYFLLPGAIPEMPSFRRALDSGKVLSETAYQRLNKRATDLVEGIQQRFEQLKIIEG